MRLKLDKTLRMLHNCLAKLISEGVNQVSVSRWL